MLQIAGEVADRVMIATYAAPEGLDHAKAMIAMGAERAGRNLADIPLISRIDTCIDDDRRAACDAVKPSIGVILWNSYPDRKFVERVGLRVPDKLEAIIAKRDYNLMEENAHLIPDEFVDKLAWAGTAADVAGQGRRRYRQRRHGAHHHASAGGGIDQDRSGAGLRRGRGAPGPRDGGAGLSVSVGGDRPLSAGAAPGSRRCA